MKAYAKALVAVAAALAVAGTLVTDGNLSGSDWVAIISAFVGALLVYAVPNTPPAK